jgi:glycosyltransferase involved in cell wall biosynthesis
MSNNTVTVVTSTRKKDDNLHRSIRKAFSHPKTEILIYENDNKMSLSEVYNKGLEESTNDIVVFMHDDLIINTTNIGNKIIKLFEKFDDYGIIGVAGTTDLINGRWWEIRKSMEGKVSHTKDGKTWTNKYSKESYIDTLKDVVCVDGVFFMVHKRRIKVKFDEDFKGFHFYDIPFCVHNFLEGVKIGVTTKFDIVHKSVGETNEQWELNKVQFEEKFKDILPLRMTNNKSLLQLLNYSRDSIGVGMVTYNAPHRIKQSAVTVPIWIKHFVIVNDGTPYEPDVYPKHAYVIQHETNKSVGVAKNTAMKYLLEQGCEHIFIMEDDVLLQTDEVFDKYIKTSIYTGIKHFNYALQGPANKKGAQGFSTLDERAKQENLSEPNPRQIIKYGEGVEVALYPNCVGAFSYYHKDVLEDVGFFDEFYRNAWEHVDHTMMTYRKGYTTPYWWFADINESWKYIKDIEGCIENSTIGHTPEWHKNFNNGFIHFKQKHGFGPTQVPDTNPQQLQKVLNKLYQNR